MLVQRNIMIVLVLCFLLLGTAFAGSGGSNNVNVAGVVGLRPVGASSCIAVWIPIPDDKALSGFSFFNNDAGTIFPEILLESGTPNDPVTLQESQLMVENVQGFSSQWSEVVFPSPVGCLSEGLYVLIHFPVGDEYTADGSGGGAGLGYATDGTGNSGWISADGEEWVAFKGEFGFAIRPQFTDLGNATVIMQRGANDASRAPSSMLVTALNPAVPNPFNPSTKLSFSLAKEGFVELNIFNIRGQKVATLIQEVLSAGSHERVWAGCDDNKRGVASGVYFIRLKTGSSVMSQRIVLVQ